MLGTLHLTASAQLQPTLLDPRGTSRKKSPGNRKVVLIWHCRTENGWRRFPVLFGKTGRVRHGVVVIAGKEHEYAVGHYELRYYIGAQMLYRPVGKNPTDALAAQQKEVRLLKARNAALAAGLPLLETKERFTIAEYGELFLEEKILEPHRSRDSADGYRVIVNEFLSSCRKIYPEQVAAIDVLRYCAGLEKRGLSRQETEINQI